MNISLYTKNDLKEIITLFGETIRAINKYDYNDEQIKVWATDENQIDRNAWHNSFSKSNTFVAKHDDVILGFVNIYSNGHLDKLYVHKDYQRQGVANKLCECAENSVKVSHVHVDASITSVPFFKSRDYKVLNRQEVIRNDITLINYKMEKILNHLSN